MSEPTNADIMMALGQLTADMRNVREELGLSREGRKLLYDKMEQTNQNVNEMGWKLNIAHELATKARDEVKALSTEISPLIEIKKDLKDVVGFQKDASKTGKVLIYLMTIGGASILGFVIWFGDMITQWAKLWLGIPPA